MEKGRMIPLELSIWHANQLLAGCLVFTAALLFIVSIIAVYWMSECKEADDYIAELKERLKPYEQPGFTIVPDVETYNENTSRWEPVLAPEVQRTRGRALTNN
jgi:hypothetical protein